MNKFLQKLGVPPKIQVVDVYSLDPELLAVVPQPVLALLLLFPCDDKVSIEYSNMSQTKIVKFD